MSTSEAFSILAQNNLNFAQGLLDFKGRISSLEAQVADLQSQLAAAQITQENISALSTNTSYATELSHTYPHA